MWGMKLKQGQIWKKGDDYFRIVKWERTEIVYKAMVDPLSKAGEVHTVTKKEFCRLLKGAELLDKATSNPAPEAESAQSGETGK